MVSWEKSGHYWEKSHVSWENGNLVNNMVNAPTRPEGAEALSPGQSPWVNQQSAMRPVRAKALKITPTTNILTLKKFINRKRNR